MGNTPVMVAYDFLELLKAIRVCVTKPHYHVGVFTKSAIEAQKISHEAHNAIREDFDEAVMLDRVTNSTAEQIITFKNGSYMRFIRASDNARGNRFHHILYDKSIDDRTKRVIIGPMQFRYMEE